MANKYTTETFIQRAKEVHGDKYNYDKVKYTKSDHKVIIICLIHGEFLQLPYNHLRGVGCIKCWNLRDSNSKTKTTNDFIKKAKEIHGDKYDYSKSVYINHRIKVEIICHRHGPFFQRPDTHIAGSGCTKCYIEDVAGKAKLLSQEEFIQKANKVHNNRYDYSKVNYINCRNKIIIICLEHGEFKQFPDSHLSGNGCPACNSSKGELKIRQWLVENNIEFEEQKIFDNCKYKNNLRFDFYLLEYNLCIEYNGLQHYKPIDYFGGKETLITQKERDKVKYKYCEDNNIDFLIIKYNQFENINNILERKLKIYEKNL